MSLPSQSSGVQCLCPGLFPLEEVALLHPQQLTGFSPCSEGERPTPNEKKKEKGMKRGGNRFEPYANPAKRYRAFITNIPFDVKWQSLKDLVKEKGKVQLRCPGCPVLQPLPGSVWSSALALLGALGHTRLEELFPEPCWVLHNLAAFQGTLPVEASGVQLVEPHPGISSVFLRDPAPGFQQIGLEVQQNSVKHFNVFWAFRWLRPALVCGYPAVSPDSQGFGLASRAFLPLVAVQCI